MAVSVLSFQSSPCLGSGLSTHNGTNWTIAKDFPCAGQPGARFHFRLRGFQYCTYRALTHRTHRTHGAFSIAIQWTRKICVDFISLQLSSLSLDDSTFGITACQPAHNLHTLIVSLYDVARLTGFGHVDIMSTFTKHSLRIRIRIDVYCPLQCTR